MFQTIEREHYTLIIFQTHDHPAIVRGMFWQKKLHLLHIAYVLYEGFDSLTASIYPCESKTSQYSLLVYCLT